MPTVATEVLIVPAILQALAKRRNLDDPVPDNDPAATPRHSLFAAVFILATDFVLGPFGYAQCFPPYHSEQTQVYDVKPHTWAAQHYYDFFVGGHNRQKYSP